MSNILKTAVGVALGLFLFFLLILALSGPSSNWKHSKTTDPMTDKLSAEALLFATSGGGQMALSCEDNGPVALTFRTSTRAGGYLANENYVSRMVRYRVDDGPVADTVATFGDHFIGFAPGERKFAAPLLEALPRASRLALDATSVPGESIQMVFDVDGAQDALERVQEDCRTN